MLKKSIQFIEHEVVIRNIKNGVDRYCGCVFEPDWSEYPSEKLRFTTFIAPTDDEQYDLTLAQFIQGRWNEYMGH